MPNESFNLDGLELNSGTYLLAGSPDMPPPRKRPEWAEFTDDSGGLLVRDPLFENRTIELQVDVWAASRNAGQAAVGALVDKLEEADRNRDGIPLVWTPANSTKSLTFYVLTGEVSSYPIDVASGYFSSPPVLRVGLVLTCKPHGYYPEVAGPSTTASTPIVSLTVPAVPGDDAAEARLVIADTASQTRDFVAWGLEQRYYSGTDLQLNTTDLTVSGFAGVSTTRAGSSSTNVFRGTLTTSAVAVCGTGNEAHIGSYRVFCRYWASGLGVRLRLVWRDGESPFSTNPWVAPPAEDAWCETDLGLITVPQAELGAQRWTGQIEAYSDVGGDTLDVDYLLLVPTDHGFGKARRPASFETSTAFAARDEFNQAAGPLTGKTAPAGGVWGGAGDATDFDVGTTGGSIEPVAYRTATADADINTGRYAFLPASMAAQVVQVDFMHNRSGVVAGIQEAGVLARYVDTNNWLMAVTRTQSGGVFEVRKRVAGTVTDLFSSDVVPFQPRNVWYTFRLAVDAAGRWAVWYYRQGAGANVQPVAQGQDSALATGGALAAGLTGFYDVNTGASTTTRQFNNTSAFVPLPDAICWAGQSIEFRHDQTLREDSTGLYAGPPHTYRGAPFYLPPAGDEGRTSRVAVIARRNDIETLTAANVTDGLSVAVHYRPRALVAPR